MKMKFALLTILAGFAVTVAQPADARRGDQVNAREQMKSGKVMSLREIEARVLPRMRGKEYLGPEYDSGAQVYRLKFIEKNRVIFVDVDARSGRVLRQR
ncbi:MAG: PepSY domain-containing protein [Sphingorhabdus sp.]